MTDLTHVSWEWALHEARRGEPTPLAAMIVRSTPPADLARDIELVIAHPRIRGGNDGRPRKLDAAKAAAVRRYFDALTTDLGPAWKAWPAPRATAELAASFNVSKTTIERTVGLKKAPAKT
jgi:hypothetical protein